MSENGGRWTVFVVIGGLHYLSVEVCFQRTILAPHRYKCDHGRAYIVTNSADPGVPSEKLQKLRFTPVSQ